MNIDLIRNLLNDDNFMFYISILWGIGLTMMFKKKCHNNNCVIIKMAKNSNLKMKRNNKCFHMKPEFHKCPQKI